MAGIPCQLGGGLVGTGAGLGSPEDLSQAGSPRHIGELDLGSMDLYDELLDGFGGPLPGLGTSGGEIHGLIPGARFSPCRGWEGTPNVEQGMSTTQRTSRRA